ncbi:2-amino-4-hydroxy-6-hydroxymethyldihydropteridine diphosphokinase [Hydrocarboniphaga effusa]|uniref:2-amino-4-hydroxy-6- hydroxymethyldihydropteridine diphosphokinase n=1 Tax=Hydrocarboniphaga effusa TaxID=243629 RepID=UPI003BA929F7
MPKAYIGLGSNLDDPARQVLSALKAISRLDGVKLLQRSKLYRTPPMGPADQPDYCNAVCVADIDIEPGELMQSLLAIELQAGRVRGVQHWGPRRIDLDLLHVDGVELDTPELKLPHPGIAKRNFVVVPLAEVAPDLVIPGLGSITQAALEIDTADLSDWN